MTLERARDSYRLKSWRDAHDQFLAAAAEQPLTAQDLERLAIAAHMTGRDDESSEAWSRAHQEYLREADITGAARAGFWHGFVLQLNGETSRGSGWLARVQRLLDEEGRDGVERAYLLVPAAVENLHRGDAAAALAGFENAASAAARFGEPDLRVMALMGLGQCQIIRGEWAGGLALLDEVMVAVTEDSVSPIVVALAYCVCIDCCQNVFDLRRAREWTEALDRWCATQPGLVPYHRVCLVHRSEIKQLHGAWPAALEEARRAAKLLSESMSQPQGLGPALYQEAEMYRLRGEFARAEETYRQAARRARNPQPGLALLRLARGDVGTAAASIRTALEETGSPVEKAKVLSACVEIMLAAGRVQEARAAADELDAMAAAIEAPMLQATAARSAGAVLLAEGDPLGALRELRHSCVVWQEIEAPYECARARVLTGIACRQLGDEDTAEIEFDAARHTFAQLGAAPDLAHLDAIAPLGRRTGGQGLTSREVEVLRLVAAGKSNQAIAADLVLSEHTVRRHLQNIFTKLGVSSRAAATAFAFQNNLT